MTERDWHCAPDLLRWYAAGGTDFALASSVEAHLVGCEPCRAALSACPTDPALSPGPTDLAEVWAGIQEEIQRPALPGMLRLLRRCGLSEQDAILLSTARSLRGPWTLATSVLLVFAVVASYPGDLAGTAMYLLVAPLVPVLGVVAAFASADPTLELTTPTPYSKVRLTLLRTAAVVATSVPLVAGMGAIVPGLGWLSVAWLGPALGLLLAALAALTWFPAEVTGGVISAAWVLVVALAYAQHDPVGAVRPGVQLGYLALAAIAAVAFVLRLRHARTPGGYA